MSLSTPRVQAALHHLRCCDPVMRRLIRRVGPFTLRLERDRFCALVRSIISQQISTKAARSIRAKVETLVAPDKPTAENLALLTPGELRSAGLSPQKTRYVHDLCTRVLDGGLRIRQIGRLSDEKVITELTQVKGIGRWTAKMFLIFSLGRLDVFPYDDLGVRTAIRHLYGLHELPDKEISLSIAEPWRPYASVASWYCWRSGDLRKESKADTPGYPI